MLKPKDSKGFEGTIRKMAMMEIIIIFLMTKITEQILNVALDEVIGKPQS